MKRLSIGLLATVLSVVLGAGPALSQSVNDAVGVIEVVSEQNKTLTIDGKVFRYSGSTTLLMLDGKPYDSFDLKWLSKGTTIAYKTREAKPYPVLTRIQPFGL